MSLRYRAPLASIAMTAALLLAACESPSTSTGTTTGTGVSDMSRTGTGTGVGTGTAVGSAGVSSSAARPLDQMLKEVGVGDRVFFDYDSATLKPEGRNTIEAWAKLLRQYPAVTAVIEGHSDERGTREYNLALGERRAKAARDYLLSLGIAPDRISTVSYGKERPAAVGSNQTAWAQNRRSVIVPNN